MEVKATCVLLLVMAFLQLKTYGFTFTLKSVGTTKVTATPGDLITYNAHLIVSESTPLSFHVSLPYFQTPILNVEKIEVIGQGKNLQTAQEVYSYAKEDSKSLNSRSQSSVDFGNVTRNTDATKPGDDLVVQVQARLLDHANVTSGTVFWLYFGMHYLNDAVWVIGKSVKADLQNGPANVGVSLKIPDAFKPYMKDFTFGIDIYHLPDSKGSASSLTITLSTPSTLTTPVAKAVGPSPSFDLSTTGGISITFSEPFKVGQRAKISIKMTYEGSEKGTFVYGNIYGSFQYQTAPAGATCDLQTVEKKDDLQLAFKMYTEADICDQPLQSGHVGQTTASSANLPCCGSEQSQPSSAYGPVGWEPWWDSTVQLADEFLQRSFKKNATVTRFLTKGYAAADKFVKTFYLSYSQNGVFWKYVTSNGKPKEFIANENAVNKVFVVLDSPITARYFRLHLGKRSPKGASLKLIFHGCIDSSDTLPYEVYQRGFIATESLLFLCNVHPDRTKAKTNCYRTSDGLQWKAMHPSIVNVIGLDSATGKVYGLGVTSADTPVYMEVISAQSVRVISEEDWNTVKPGCSLPKVISLYPVHGDPLYELTKSKIIVGGVTYVATPEGLLKTESGITQMIASWTEYK